LANNSNATRKHSCKERPTMLLVVKTSWLRHASFGPRAAPAWLSVLAKAQQIASRLAARKIVSSTLACASVAQRRVTAWAANNCDRHHVAVWGKLFTFVVPLPNQPSIPLGSLHKLNANDRSKLRLGMQKQVCFIPFLDKRVGVWHFYKFFRQSIAVTQPNGTTGIELALKTRKYCPK